MRQHEFVDSRGTAWRVTVSGPTRSGSLRPGEDILAIPERWMARYSVMGRPETIEIELYEADPPVDDLQATLEADPDWIHGDWHVESGRDFHPTIRPPGEEG